MTAVRILLGVVAWACLATPVAVIVGRAARLRDRRETPTAPTTEPWSPAAVNAEFAALIPSMVTADVFALDAELGRKARWDLGWYERGGPL